MSFGGQSNAPWQRNVMQNHPQSGAFHQGSAQMFMQTQSNMAAAFNHGGGSGSMFSSGGGTASVSYPQPRSGLNPVAFQQGGSGGGGGQAQHYNSIGTVTKINNECGLVNDEVFFYRNACKGPEPKLGDRVIFEATYATSGQFKWNATRIQLMQHQPQPLMGSSKGYGSSADFSRGHGMRHSSPKRAVSPIRSRHERERRDRERRERSRDRSEEGRDRKRLREDPDRSRERIGRPGAGAIVARGDRDRHVERDREDKEKRDRIREKEPLGSKRGRNRPIRRYMVQIPKYQLAYKTSDIQELRQRYSTLYIPSDFFHANIKWTQNFTPENPFSLRRPCRFHIMHKLVEPPFEQKPELLEPADANYLYSAKVMLMSLPTIAELYQKCFEHEDDNADHHGVHPSRLISFLVGVRGRNEPMAIGGPWSPSLDGENPDKDPAVLIRTAIRTCKALTGIDLSYCTQWYRFVELYYHRTEYKNMEKDGPPRVETVVIFLPDVHACMPTAEDWPNLIETYKATAEDIIARRTAAANKAIAAAAAAAEEEEDEEKAAAAKVTENPDEEDVEINEVGDNDDDDDNGEDDNDDANNDAVIAIADDPETNGDADDDHSAAADDNNTSTTTITSGDGAVDVDDNIATVDADENEEPPPEPTHYTLLDLKSMKVQEIRDELLARNLSDKGVRNVVMARLAKALNTEKAQELQSKKHNKATAKPVTVAKTTKEVKVKLEKCDNKVKKVVLKDEPMDVDISVNSSTLKKKTTAPKEQASAKENAANNKQKKDKGKSEVMKEKKEKSVKENIEEQEKPWTEADFEMNEMLILDEYDATKNPEDVTPKEMSEKEKAQLIRRYTLPEQPQIIVHPNKMAKGGKFDCAVMSLSVLLDYHPEDTKERFFEVSLFAELFNEMMMRDFGFNIYKEIYLHKESTITEDPAKAVDEEKLDNENATETNKEDKAGKKDDNKTNSTVVENNKEDKNAISIREHTDDTQSMKSETRKRKLSVSVSINDKEPSDKDKKMVVHKPLLLLSFIYFDETQCGYIFEKDLEDLFAILGLNLSRSQIKKMLSKLPTRQAIYYRKLTDKEESLDCTPYIEDDDNLSFEELKRIAAGNWFYEDVFGDQTYPYDEDNPDDAADEHEQDKDDGLINYHGAVVHVGKLMEQIKRTERVHSDLEKIYNDLLKQHAELQKDHNKSNSKIKDLNSEVKSLARKLNDTTTDLNAVNRKYRDQNNTLQYIYNRVSPYFIREKDKEKEKEKDKDHKAENAKDADKDKEKEKKVEEKDKEKEKSKEKDKNKEVDIEKETKDKNKEDKDIKEKSVKDENREKENNATNITTKTTATNPTKPMDKAKKSISDTKSGEAKTSDKDAKKTNEATAKK